MSDSIKKSAIIFKQRAKELGYEIKLTHCQEILAKVNGHKNRHSYLMAEEPSHDIWKSYVRSLLSRKMTALSENDLSILNDPGFNAKIENFVVEFIVNEMKQDKSNFFPENEKFILSNPINTSIESYSIKNYMDSLDQNKFQDNFMLGLTRNNNETVEHLKNLSIKSNMLFVGAGGSGKSLANMFTTTTWLLSNSENTSIYIIDLTKGANDYKELFNYPQVKKIADENNFFQLINDAYEEAILRLAEFKKMNAINLFDYEVKTKTKMTRIIFVLEDFHCIPYNILNFDKNYDIDGTMANKFFFLMRIGQSLGMLFSVSAQRGTASDIPESMLYLFPQKQIFKVSKAESMYLLGNFSAAEIALNQGGRCQTYSGEIQFPRIEDNLLKFLLKKYVKPLKAKNFFLQ
jgi:hypothetical protein